MTYDLINYNDSDCKWQVIRREMDEKGDYFVPEGPPFVHREDAETFLRGLRAAD